ncbi:hypothetical protein VHEMI04837 [[Torrubiella] hemipterigena]|uniref:Dipeptidyl-peptidase V n=1 Tax=[Torrubiella] hemipterigena TaxID=1531966 RepID=A0A0A1TFE9_9HYPO|nr:hypothetical protein VHEMI04837 [[Torrubiella] hemipterigena]
MGVSSNQLPAFDASLAQDLCDLEIPEVIRFSPDGSKIVYSTNLTWNHTKGEYAVSTLWIADTHLESSACRITCGTFEDRSPVWHPDGNRIFFISDRGDPGKSSAIYNMKIAGDKADQPLALTSTATTARISTFVLSPDAIQLAFISEDEISEDDQTKYDIGPQVWGESWNYARLRILDLARQEVTTLSLGDCHVTGMSWNPTGNKLAFKSCKTPYIEEPFLTGMSISIYDFCDGQVSKLCVIKNELLDFTWSLDSHIHFITGSPIENTIAGQALYSLDVDTNSGMPERVACGEDDDAQSLRLCQERLLLSCQKRLDTCITTVSGNTIYTIDTDVYAWDVFDADAETRTLAVALSDVNNPFEVYTLRGQDRIQLSNHGSAFKDRKFGNIQVFQCRSADDKEELDGVYLTPDGYDATNPLATFVMIHGGPAVRNTNAFNAYYYFWTPFILSKGYGILLPQYRGSRGRGERFASYTIGGVGDVDYQDVIKITDEAIKKGLVDKERMIVGGYSQGGFLTFLSAVRNGLHGLGWRFNAGIAGAGVSDIDSLAGAAEMGSTLDNEQNNGHLVWTMERDSLHNRNGSALWEIKAAVREATLRNEVVIPPMLIVHGSDDTSCPFSQSEAFRRALHAYSLPYEFVRYPGQEHDIKDQRFWIDMLERIGRWCDIYIGPGFRKE